MKKIFLFIVLVAIIFVTNNVISQVVNGISYQAVVIDYSGKEIAGMDFNEIILPNTAVNIRFTILKESISGSWSVEYQETHPDTSDASGLITCVIGDGQITGDSPNNNILNLSWDSGKHFLQVELEINNSGVYQNYGNQEIPEQMQAVPYAFWALGFHETDPKWSGLPDISGKIGRLGNVAIGYTTPTAKLDITGQIKINDGTQGKGKVLTSDSTGLASWQYIAPPGTIIMYSGAWNFDEHGIGTGTLAGWALCNGYNDLTPDLTDRFVMCTTNAADTLITGGSNSLQLTPNQLPAHQHLAGMLDFIGNPIGTKTIQAAGSTVYGGDSGNNLNCFRVDASWYTNDGEKVFTVDIGTPTGSITGETGYTGSGSSIDIRPAFVKLAYIMKL